ncbi:hypothetical protein AHF37_04074 [Paragonimus kellicotti]|nr:hypothetical protein AHF37_04074 [Paragonimus kellicotti]
MAVCRCQCRTCIHTTSHPPTWSLFFSYLLFSVTFPSRMFHVTVEMSGCPSHSTF